MSLHKRLERLEGKAGVAKLGRAIRREALAALSDEELEALEETLEQGETSTVESYRLREIKELEQAMEQHIRDNLKGERFSP
jgi:hypothetical protein